MAKKKTLFECQACGFQSPRWMGKCTSCNQWETMIELSTNQIKFLKETSGSSASSPLSKAKPITQIEEDNIDLLAELERQVNSGEHSEDTGVSLSEEPNVDNDSPEASDSAEKDAGDIEVVYVKGKDGRKKPLKIDYSDKKSVKNAFLKMAGMRKFQHERDEERKQRR